MRKYRDGSLDGRLNMSNHSISGLVDPTDADDAVTRRYVASRFQALKGNKRKSDALQNLFGVVNNQVLMREYESEIIHGNFEYFEHTGDTFTDNSGRIIGALFSKYPRAPDDISKFRFINIFTLKEYFYIYLKNLLTTVHS